MLAATVARAGWAIALAVGVLAASPLADAARAATPAATAMGVRGAPPPARVPEAGQAPAEAGAGAEQQVLGRIVALTNAERARVGVAPLVGDPRLTAVAQRYTEVMAATACFGHACGPTPQLGARVAAAGGARWGFLGENVAAGQPTPERAVAAWMASPAHRAVLLDPEFTALGVGRTLGGPYGSYWAQEFGTPAPGAPAGGPAGAGLPPPPAAPERAVALLSAE